MHFFKVSYSMLHLFYCCNISALLLLSYIIFNVDFFKINTKPFFMLH